MRKIAFIVPPHFEILDLAGPAQVFTEAKFYGFEASWNFILTATKLYAPAGFHLRCDKL
jgi:hypothetical protein